MRAVPPATRRGGPLDVGTGKGDRREGGRILPSLPPSGGRGRIGIASVAGGSSDQRNVVTTAAGPVSQHRPRRGNIPHGGGLLPDVPRCPRRRGRSGGSGRRDAPSTSRGGRLRIPSERRDLFGMSPGKGGEARIRELPRVPSPPFGRGARHLLPEVPYRNRGGTVRSPPEDEGRVRFLPQDPRKRHDNGKDGGIVLRLPRHREEGPGDFPCFPGRECVRTVPSRPRESPTG